MVRTGKRLASAHLRFARAVSLSLLRSASAVLLNLRRLLLLVIRWIGPRVQALALSLVGLLRAGALWIGPKARALSLAVVKAASASSSWIAVKTAALARVAYAGAVGRHLLDWSNGPPFFARPLQSHFGKFLLDRCNDGGPCALAYAGAVGRHFLDWSKGPRARTRALCGRLDRRLLAPPAGAGPHLVVLKSSKAAGLRAQRGLGRLPVLSRRLAEKTKSGLGE